MIERSCQNYEEVYIEATTNSGWKNYDTKALTNCSSTTKMLYFTNTTNLKIRSKIINELSDIKIKVSQWPIEAERFQTAPFLFLTIVVIGFLSIFIIAFCWTFYQNYGKTPTVKDRKLGSRYGQTKRIEKVMRRMKSGNYEKVYLRYNQNSCPI